MKKFANKLRSKALVLSSAGLASLPFTSIVHTDDFDTKASTIVGSIISVLIRVVRWAGVVIVAWGIISFVMGMRDEDVEKKHKATTLAIVGIAMVLIGWLVEPVMNALGMNITINKE